MGLTPVARSAKHLLESRDVADPGKRLRKVLEALQLTTTKCNEARGQYDEAQNSEPINAIRTQLRRCSVGEDVIERLLAPPVDREAKRTKLECELGAARASASGMVRSSRYAHAACTHGLPH